MIAAAGISENLMSALLVSPENRQRPAMFRGDGAEQSRDGGRCLPFAKGDHPMQSMETQVTEETGSMAGFRVEFFATGGDRVSVLLRHAEGLSREAAVERARVLLAQLAADDSGGSDIPPIQGNGEDGR
jgi:hypothetical protein